jgi:hypothetical protein
MTQEGRETNQEIATDRSRAKGLLSVFFGAILLVVALAVVWPAIENARRPSVQRHATVVNKSDAAIFVCSVDAGGKGAYTAVVEPGKSARLDLAIGEGSNEVDTRTVQLLVLGPRGGELARATFTGEKASWIDSIVVRSGGKMEFRGRDGKVVGMEARTP